MCSLSGCVACFLKLPWLRCEFPCCSNGLPKQLFDLVGKPAKIIILIMIYSIAFNAKWSLKIKSLDDLRVKAAVRSEAPLDLTGDCQKLNLAALAAAGRAQP